MIPDIQAGDVELTKQEAAQLSQKEMGSSDQMESFMFVDELGEAHFESAHTHLGRS